MCNYINFDVVKTENCSIRLGEKFAGRKGMFSMIKSDMKLTEITENGESQRYFIWVCGGRRMDEIRISGIIIFFVRERAAIAATLLISHVVFAIIFIRKNFNWIII